MSGRRRDHRVQHVRAMGIDDALRVAGGAGGVAEAGGGILVEDPSRRSRRRPRRASPRRRRHWSSVVFGMCSASVRTMTCSIVCKTGASFSTSGTKVRSTKRRRSSAWLMIQAICSGKSRGLTVWQIAPMPPMPYQISRWRQVFQASVAQRSPRRDAVARRGAWRRERAPAEARDSWCGGSGPRPSARRSRRSGAAMRRVIEDLVAKQRPVLHQSEHGVSPCLCSFLRVERMPRFSGRHEISRAAVPASTTPWKWAARRGWLALRSNFQLPQTPVILRPNPNRRVRTMAMQRPGSGDLDDAALFFHKFPRPGKLEIQATKPLGNQRDLALAYSPGVAAPCLAIAADPATVSDYTVARQSRRGDLQRHGGARPRQYRRARRPSR